MTLAPVTRHSQLQHPLMSGYQQGDHFVWALVYQLTGYLDAMQTVSDLNTSDTGSGSCSTSRCQGVSSGGTLLGHFVGALHQHTGYLTAVQTVIDITTCDAGFNSRRTSRCQGVSSGHSLPGAHADSQVLHIQGLHLQVCHREASQGAHGLLTLLRFRPYCTDSALCLTGWGRGGGSGRG